MDVGIRLNSFTHLTRAWSVVGEGSGFVVRLVGEANTQTVCLHPGTMDFIGIHLLAPVELR